LPHTFFFAENEIFVILPGIDNDMYMPVIPAGSADIIEALADPTHKKLVKYTNDLFLSPRRRFAIIITTLYRRARPSPPTAFRRHLTRRKDEQLSKNQISLRRIAFSPASSPKSRYCAARAPRFGGQLQKTPRRKTMRTAR
jgi:hypothetical protein